jgi:chorismate mutase
MMEQQITKKEVAGLLHKKHLLIAGPCSAETPEQLIQTATQIAANGKTDVLRAGIWKPRTRPGSFEGVGVKGLPWLLEAKKITGLPVAVEVATAKQVEDSLQFEVDILWLGARTTVNPFSVQELADALRGVDVPVLIKNPVNADIDLWIGAVERISNAGIKDIGLIHRGFSSYGNTEYRNAPMWQLAIEMKRRNKNLPIICDPSHICGKRDNLLEISQRAIDLDYDGLMIETHLDPDSAWSDAKQQVTPARLMEILEQIIWKNETVNEAGYLNALMKLREQINHIDDELLQLLSQRMKIADHIGVFKKQNNVTVLQTNRWNEILERAINKGDALGLSKEFITKYFDAVHLESISHQNKLK